MQKGNMKSEEGERGGVSEEASFTRSDIFKKHGSSSSLVGTFLLIPAADWTSIFL